MDQVRLWAPRYELSLPHDLYPYQFEGGLQMISRGWLPLFGGLCDEVDQALGADKQGFRWTVVREKFGVARFQFALDGARSSPARLNIITPQGVLHHDLDLRSDLPAQNPGLLKELGRLVDLAERESAGICQACGKPGEIDDHRGWLMVVCDDHKAQRRLGQHDLAVEFVRLWTDDEETRRLQRIERRQAETAELIERQAKRF